jgi:putative acetyltransferase
MLIRRETPQDITAIREITTQAFANTSYSNQKEHALIDALREAGGLKLSLVAEEHGHVVGHIGFSPITINSEDRHWLGLAPLSVAPEMQHRGIGRSLVQEGLKTLRAEGARGCVVLGNPVFYSHFGFHTSTDLKLEGVPPEYFLVQVFSGALPHGFVDYHAAFSLYG